MTVTLRKDSAPLSGHSQLPVSSRNSQEGSVKKFRKTLQPYASGPRALYSMFFVALVIRLVVSLVMIPEFTDPYRDHWHFGWEMGRIAHEICMGRGFSSPFFDPSGPTAMLPPAYPYLVALCMKLFGGFTAGSAMAILTLNSIFASLTVIPVYFLAKRVLNERTALVSGWAWAFFPYSIYLAGGRIYSDTLTCLIASLLWLQTLRLRESRALYDWLLWGALWGAAGLVSPVLLGPLPLLAAWLAVKRTRSGLPWLVPGILAACVLLVIVAPWTVRNYRAFGRFIPLRDGFWMEVHVGYNGDTSDVTPDSAHPTTSAVEYAQWRQLGEIGYMDAKKSQAIAYIREHPEFFAWVTFRHFVNMWTGFWSLDPKFLSDEPFHIPNTVFATVMTLLMIGGLRYAWLEGKGEAVFPLLVILLTFPLVYYVTHSSMDYRHPLDPIIVILDCYCVLEMAKSRRSSARYSDMAE